MIKNNNRYTAVFWFIMMLLPLLVYWLGFYGQSLPFLEWTDEFAFVPIKTALDACFGVAFDIPFPMSGYFSWLVFLEVARLLVDILTFIPRFARGVCERFGDARV